LIKYYTSIKPTNTSYHEQVNGLYNTAYDALRALGMHDDNRVKVARSALKSARDIFRKTPFGDNPTYLYFGVEALYSV
jgi:hypothetical protein